MKVSTIAEAKNNLSHLIHQLEREVYDFCDGLHFNQTQEAHALS